jgi:hypothetical protein
MKVGFFVTCSKCYFIRSRRGLKPRCVTFWHTNDKFNFEPFLGYFRDSSQKHDECHAIFVTIYYGF